MKISQVNLVDFKRFSNLTIRNIPSSAKAVLIVGPNGSGKSSIFDAFLHWYRLIYKNSYNTSQEDYYFKKGGSNNSFRNFVNISFHDLAAPTQTNLKGKFYFRTAYRNDSDFTINNLSRQNDPTENIKFENFIQNDAVVRENYERLISLTLKGVYDDNNNTKSVGDLKEELVGRIRQSFKMYLKI